MKKRALSYATSLSAVLTGWGILRPFSAAIENIPQFFLVSCDPELAEMELIAKDKLLIEVWNANRQVRASKSVVVNTEHVRT